MEFDAALVEDVKNAELVVVSTGAGLSADSGIPTFRDAQTGLWANFKPEELATPEAFLANPKTVWDWYAWRRNLVNQAQPNPGHLAIAELERLVKRLVVVTQNVDALHKKSGSEHIIEFHGNIMRNRCFTYGTAVEDQVSGSPPTCPCCGGYVRPDVVWFGEAIDPNNLEQAFTLTEQCDLFFSVGTSSLVYPAAGLLEMAIQQTCTTVEINPEPTPLSGHVDYSFADTATSVLPALVQNLQIT